MDFYRSGQINAPRLIVGTNIASLGSQYLRYLSIEFNLDIRSPNIGDIKRNVSHTIDETELKIEMLSYD